MNNPSNPSGGVSALTFQTYGQSGAPGIFVVTPLPSVDVTVLDNGGSAYEMYFTAAAVKSLTVVMNGANTVSEVTLAASTPNLTITGFNLACALSLGTFTFTTFTTPQCSDLTLNFLPDLASADISAQTTSTGFMIASNPLLTTLVLPASFQGGQAFTALTFSGNALNQATVDGILALIVAANSPGGACVIDLSGGTNSAPSVAGAASVATLQGAGWTVVTN